MGTRPFANTTASALQTGRTLMMDDIESARISMMEARKALEKHEGLKGCAISGERLKLIQVFNRATKTYLRLSASQR
jgi:hypothetical protein